VYFRRSWDSEASLVNAFATFTSDLNSFMCRSLHRKRPVVREGYGKFSEHFKVGMQEVMRAWILGLNNCEFSSFMVHIPIYLHYDKASNTKSTKQAT